MSSLSFFSPSWLFEEEFWSRRSVEFCKGFWVAITSRLGRVLPSMIDLTNLSDSEDDDVVIDHVCYPPKTPFQLILELGLQMQCLAGCGNEVVSVFPCGIEFLCKPCTSRLRAMKKPSIRCSCGSEHLLVDLRDVATAMYTNKQRHILRQKTRVEGEEEVGKVGTHLKRKG